MRRWLATILAFMTAAAAVAHPVLASAPASPAQAPEQAADQAAERPAETEERPVVKTDASSPFVQQGLTIHELEKELVRLKEQQADLSEEISALAEDLERQKQQLDVRKEAAGRVLRAYYMGQRDNLWLLLFRIDSLNEALAALDYLQAIWANDTRTLVRYRKAYEERAALLAELSAREERLDFVIAEHEAQRRRMLDEQAELDRKLAELAEEERQMHLAAIASVTAEWEEIGVPLFEEVLTALSAAMADLPELLADPGLIAVSDGGMEVRLTDGAFNDFLQERDPIFESFRFRFSPDGMTVSGEIDERTASLRGMYFLEHEPENALRFVIDSVLFNGMELPDTTKAAMQEQYDLTFEPGRLVSGLTVSELIHEEGMLRVKLSLSLLGGSLFG